MKLADHMLETCRLKKETSTGKERKEAEIWELHILSLIESDLPPPKRRAELRKQSAKESSL